MRRWLAKHLHPDRRWATLGLTFLWIGVSFQLLPSLWVLAFQRGLPEPTDVLVQKVQQSVDPVETQNLLAQLNGVNARNGVELDRRHRNSSLFTRLGLGMLALSLVPNLVHFSRARRRARWLKAGCCIECGYDLRESAERCPECGTAPSLAV